MRWRIQIELSPRWRLRQVVTLLLGSRLEPRQRVRNPLVEQPGAKSFDQAPSPSWREGKVSAKCHTCGCAVNCRTHELIVAYNPEWKRRSQLDAVSRRVHLLDHGRDVPTPAKSVGVGVHGLARLGWPRGNDRIGLGIP